MPSVHESIQQYSTLLGDVSHSLHGLIKHHNLVCFYEQACFEKAGQSPQTLDDIIDFDPYQYSMIYLLQNKDFRPEDSASILEKMSELCQQQAMSGSLLMYERRLGGGILNRCQELLERMIAVVDQLGTYIINLNLAYAESCHCL